MGFLEKIKIYHHVQFLHDLSPLKVCIEVHNDGVNMSFPNL